MATLTELVSLFSDDVLRNKVTAAICKKAYALLSGAPTADQKIWSQKALADPTGELDWLFKYLLAANANLSVAEIQGAGDNAIETAVNAAVDVLYPAA